MLPRDPTTSADWLTVAETNAAIRQSDAEAVPLDADTWRGVVAKRAGGLPRDAVVADVRPFLERGEKMAGRADVLGLLEARSR